MTRKSQLAYGSVKWFLEARRAAYKEILSLIHIRSAAEFAHKLLEKHEQTISSALFKAMVVDYGKPFTHSAGVDVYAFNSIKQAPGVIRDIHDEMLKIRNKLVAHQDDEYTDCSLLAVSNFKTEGNSLIQNPVTIHFAGLLLAGVGDEKLLRDITNHITSCHNAINKNAIRQLELYMEAISKNNGNYAEFMSAHGSSNATDFSSSQLTDKSIAFEYTITLKTPSIKNKNGFIYMAAQFNHSRAGRITAIDENGKTHEIFIDSVDQT